MAIVLTGVAGFIGSHLANNLLNSGEIVLIPYISSVSVKANVYLSKYFPFISSNKNHPVIQEIIYKALNEFFTLHICCYEKYKNVEINFVGSVAYHLSEEIKDVMRKNNCKFGRIVKDPIKELVKFHSKENIKDS